MVNRSNPLATLGSDVDLAFTSEQRPMYATGCHICASLSPSSDRFGFFLKVCSFLSGAADFIGEENFYRVDVTVPLALLARGFLAGSCSCGDPVV